MMIAITVFLFLAGLPAPFLSVCVLVLLIMVNPADGAHHGNA